MVQKLTAYEHYHSELYQEKFKRHVNMAQVEDSDDSGGEEEVAVAEWTRGANPVPCKWVLALLKYPFYPLFILDNGMNLISKSLTTPA